MDTHDKIREIRAEYKEYLMKKHPNWSESTLNTHLSDAYFIWNNTVIPGFWKVFVSNESMNAARESIRDFLKNDTKSDRYEERTTAYFNELKMMKEFFDTEYEGVANRIGSEFDAEEIIYAVCKKHYDGVVTEEEALEELSEKVPSFSTTSHKMTLSLFNHMMEGSRYSRRSNIEITVCLIRNIGKDYGKEKMLNALFSTRENIIYYYSQTGNKSNCMRKCCQQISDKNGFGLSFGEDIFTGVALKKNNSSALGDDDVEPIRYWLYSPGERAFNWERDIETGTMALGWDFLGDFRQYNSEEELVEIFQKRYNDTSSHKNDKCAVLDFVNKMKIGDVVFAKRGTDTIIGKGIVKSDYSYDETLDKYKNIRKVQWTDIGEWEHPGKAVVKTLTDITIYDGYPEDLIARIEGKRDEKSFKEAVELYTKLDFLNEVYISEEKYETCVSRLKHKKNIILQGAPGVGKTFAARRLAWSIMGVKDDNRIEFVQFHQSYSYEDFIMGYKPAGDGFALEKGLFYNFCLKAKDDPDNDYFFIIDEINRGNMSKIFGELLMLIENDYRDMEITLAYDKKTFSVPENLYIIGMMNTADRSLAMIDYALRRRFSFVEMTPGFDSEGFISYQSAINNDNFNKLISRVKVLNADIENDASLGKGFCIGHSYFCGLKEDCTDAVLKEIVEYDIIPMLEEYWFDDEAKAKNWSNDLSGVFNG